MRKLPLFLAVLLIPIFALAACGGGGDDGAEDEIVETIETSALSTDPADCGELATLRFLEQTNFREGKAALRRCEADAKRAQKEPKDIKSVEVSNVEIDGSEANAEVAFEGGTFDGQVFSVAMVEEDGNWKMGEILGFAEFDQVKFAEAVEEQVENEAEGLEPEVLACIGEEFSSMSRGELERLVTAGREQPLEEVIVGCI